MSHVKARGNWGMRTRVSGEVRMYEQIGAEQNYLQCLQWRPLGDYWRRRRLRDQ